MSLVKSGVAVVTHTCNLSMVRRAWNLLVGQFPLISGWQVPVKDLVSNTWVGGDWRSNSHQTAESKEYSSWHLEMGTSGFERERHVPVSH